MVPARRGAVQRGARFTELAAGEAPDVCAPHTWLAAGSRTSPTACFMADINLSAGGHEARLKCVCESAAEGRRPFSLLRLLLLPPDTLAAFAASAAGVVCFPKAVICRDRRSASYRQQKNVMCSPSSSSNT